MQLKALLLRAMDAAQAGKYLGVFGPAGLAFDQANQRPGLLLMPPGGGKPPSRQASPETPVECVLVGFRNVWVVEVVVGTGVEHAVPEDRGSQPRSSGTDRKSTRQNSSHLVISYAVFCLKKKKNHTYRLDGHLPHTGHESALLVRS